jgi:hypothetical protein
MKLGDTKGQENRVGKGEGKGKWEKLKLKTKKGAYEKTVKKLICSFIQL